MMVDDALRVAAKHPSPTTTRKKHSEPASPEKVPCSQTPPEPRKKNVPPFVIDDKLKTTALLKTLVIFQEKKIMGKSIPGKRLKYYLRRLKTTGTSRDISLRSTSKLMRLNSLIKSN
ncbi:hypothetical protein AVEN_189808-1 [Araneus ventricosus]|uniref:Uncharacterized protein n=1 Tax=Araneus ventricosus TaxID=182803 RepID=A0A4Y2UM02_ARAVE|nr:hypothetical protein AVEN_189808-1 [Araneus ventricosus]